VQPERPLLVITGASRGIGRSLSEHFLNAGYRVVGVSRSENSLTSEYYEHHQVDVTDEQAVSRLIRDVHKAHGHIDGVINNAGVAAMNHSLTLPLATFDKVMDTNAKGTFIMTREAAKVMRKQKRGRVVNLSSVAVPLSIEGEAAYAASKSAVETLTRVMARELASFGITVNAVGPGPIETDLIRGVPSEKIDALVKRLAIPRRGNMDDIANVIEFFLNDRSDFITGQIVYLGGA
jgi:3-oxoacyl-[acyl-carrier protein] reductase